MTNQSGGAATEQSNAAERIEEAKQLYRNISQTLDLVLKEVNDGGLTDSTLLPKLATQLQAVVADIHKKEAEFDERYGSGHSSGVIDFDDLRREVGAALVASVSAAKRSEFIDSLDNHQVKGLLYMFDFWAFEHQLPPDGDWRTWVILGGRGAGKTRAGAGMGEIDGGGSRPRDPGAAKTVGLIGQTHDQVRDVMVFGEWDSGLFSAGQTAGMDREPKDVAVA